jgi:hypothetical protein
MASFNQNPLGQELYNAGIGVTFYSQYPIGIGTINTFQIIDTTDATGDIRFVINSSASPTRYISLLGGGDTRPSVGLVYPR